MLSERHNAASLNLYVATENHPDLRDVHHTKHDTRRFAGIFPREVLGAVSLDYGEVSREQQNDSDHFSRLDLVASLDGDNSTTQTTSIASVNQNSSISAAQQIVACHHRATHGRGHAPEFVPINTGEKELPQIPDDQHSVYTLAASTDTQPTMDMMWRPKPKVHMHRSDQRALMQAQNQAIAMMHHTGLKPTNKIQCRRWGCADILPDVEALKYHLHIHNIADAATRCRDPSPSAASEFHLPECNTSNSESSKRNHSRSRSSLGTQEKCSTTSPLTRKLLAGGFLPALFSPRESGPQAPQVPALTTVAKTIIPDPSPNKPTSLLPARNDETLSTHTSTPSRGRRKRKGNMAVAVGAECSPSIAMLLSPPSSPIMHGRLVLAPHAKLHTPITLGPDNRVSILNESVDSVSEQRTRSRSSVRALSPTRAMSPIRNGIKHILSIGCPDNVTDK